MKEQVSKTVRGWVAPWLRGNRSNRQFIAFMAKSCNSYGYSVYYIFLWSNVITFI